MTYPATIAVAGLLLIAVLYAADRALAGRPWRFVLLLPAGMAAGGAAAGSAAAATETEGSAVVAGAAVLLLVVVVYCVRGIVRTFWGQSARSDEGRRPNSPR